LSNIIIYTDKKNTNNVLFIFIFLKFFTEILYLLSSSIIMNNKMLKINVGIFMGKYHMWRKNKTLYNNNAVYHWKKYYVKTLNFHSDKWKKDKDIL